MQDPLNVAFFHPDLGIGGAERLVVDAGIALQGFQNKVTIYTSYHNPKRCFKETQDGTLKVYVEGMKWPRTFFGGIGHVFWAVWRMIWCVLRVMIAVRKQSAHQTNLNKGEQQNLSRGLISEFLLFLLGTIMNVMELLWSIIITLWNLIIPQEEARIASASDATSSGYDAYFVDQIPIAIVFLKLFAPLKPNGEKPLIVFYCHFPDKLLAQYRDSKNPLRRLYRYVFDKLEEWSMKKADLILVNSKFTQNIFMESFPTIKQKPQVLYPSLYEESYDTIPENLEESSIYKLFGRKHVVVSINRFEKKKNHMLALEAFAKLENYLPDFKQKCHLVIAGGFDPRLKENVDVKAELEKYVKENNLSDQVTLVPSFNNIDRYLLLHKSNVILYTPENEHFGIVPIEAMYCRRPIIAVNSGGPMESIKNNETGFLCPPDATEFAKRITEILSDSKIAATMGNAGRERVKNLFSIKVFGSKLNDYLHEPRKKKHD